MISRSLDLQRLQNEGYNLRVVTGTAAHLVISDVPYVNSQAQVCVGTLVSPLTLNGDVTVNPLTGNHQTWFIGEYPCNHDGTPIAEIKYQSQKFDLGNEIVCDHSFSSKPLNQVPYDDYYAKMTRYIDIISAPAKYLQLGITAKTFPLILPEDESNVFHYADSASARSGIGAISASLAMGKVAIIGLGGTGSYVLDLVAKTHVKEIHLYDADTFLQHNAFRAPGAAATADFNGSSKVAYFAGLYDRMRKGIFPHEEKITEANVQSLAAFDFVFICIDNPPGKEIIVSTLCANRVPFIDVGMDIQVHGGNKLDGFCRTTLVTAEKQDHIADQISFGAGRKNDLYASNIQTADMNCLNATLAVIKWKQFCGFYQDYKNEHFSLFTMGTKALVKK